MKTLKRKTGKPETKAAPRETLAAMTETKEGATGLSGLLVGDITVAYAFTRNVRDRNLHHLLKMEIKDDRVVRVEKSTEDLRGILMAKLEHEILADA